jgi:hypothetical protein
MLTAAVAPSSLTAKSHLSCLRAVAKTLAGAPAGWLVRWACAESWMPATETAEAAACQRIERVVSGEYCPTTWSAWRATNQA